ALTAILTIRFYMFYMAVAAILISLLLFSGRRIGTALTNQVLLAGILALAFAFLGLRQEAEANLDVFDFERLSHYRYGLAVSAESGWMQDVDVSTPAKAIAFMPYGLALLLFSPFPWQFNGLRPLLTLPEMLVWWSMTFAWIRGFMYALRARRSDLAPLL